MAIRNSLRKNLILIKEDTSGAIFIETAFIFAFVLAPILIGILEFGLFMYEYTQVVKIVESASLYATRNSANLYAMEPFSSSSIVTAAGTTPWKESVSVNAGCACANSVTGNITQFQAAPLPKCNQTPVCSGNTQPTQPYVVIKATHSHSYIFLNNLFPNLSASYSNFVRIN